MTQPGSETINVSKIQNVRIALKFSLKVQCNWAKVNLRLQLNIDECFFFGNKNHEHFPTGCLFLFLGS
jgi:hypothetical protein